jgi:hypothetical protein
VYDGTHSLYLKKGNNPFYRVEHFRRLETNLTNQNSIYDEAKSRLWVKNLLSSSLLSKNIKVKVHINLILLVVLYGCETCSISLWKERRLRDFGAEKEHKIKLKSYLHVLSILCFYHWTPSVKATTPTPAGARNLTSHGSPFPPPVLA